MPGSPGKDEISARLQAYLGQRSPDALTRDFEFLASGFESDIYTFTLQPAAGGSRSLILRLYLGEGVAPKVLREARGMERLHQAGYPVPEVFYSETDPSALGKPFLILEKLEGRPLWPVLSESPSAQAVDLLERFGGLIALLHRLDWRPFSGQAARYETDPAALREDLLAPARLQYTQMGVPGFLPILDWVEKRISKIEAQPAVVHLDLHANNVFLCADGRLAVIDWSQVTVADFRVDLAWTLMIMGDYGLPGWREIILRAYQRQSERRVENLACFEVLADLKLLASTVIALRAGPAALGLHPDAYPTAAQQAPILSRLYSRIQAAAGQPVPEVEAVLASL